MLTFTLRDEVQGNHKVKRRLFLAAILPLAAFSKADAFFDQDHHGHEKGKGGHNDDDHDDEGPRGHAKGHVRYFRPEDRVILGHYYPVQSLPPGLRKKYARTGTLPPGWQNRLQPLPVAVVKELPPPPLNCERGYVDGYAVVYDRRTRVILDAVDLIGAVTGH
jgi:hypothetical protein